LKKWKETFVNEIDDFLLAIALVAWTELAELLDDLAVLEVDADEFVIVSATFDGAPVTM